MIHITLNAFRHIISKNLSDVFGKGVKIDATLGSGVFWRETRFTPQNLPWKRVHLAIHPFLRVASCLWTFWKERKVNFVLESELFSKTFRFKKKRKNYLPLWHCLHHRFLVFPSIPFPTIVTLFAPPIPCLSYVSMSSSIDTKVPRWARFLGGGWVVIMLGMPVVFLDVGLNNRGKHTSYRATILVGWVVTDVRYRDVEY